MFKELFEAALGDCYVQAYRYFNSNFDRKLRLVHGLVTGQGDLDGIVYNHAWVEDGSKIIDLTLPKPLQKSLTVKEYYRLGKIETTFKYTHKEVQEKSIEYETYGPWEKILLKNKF